MNWFALKVGFYDSKCQLLKASRLVKNTFLKPARHQYLFVLCPPYGGSTLMHELLCTSSAVSANNIFGTREGLGLPEARPLFDYTKRWDEAYAYPWEAIRKTWMSYWDHSKPVLLEKSPSHMIRVAAIEQHFRPVKFIAMTRNPYAHCESLIRRDKMNTQEAAEFSVRCLYVQKNNLEQAEDILYIAYEDLVSQPEETAEKMIRFLPELNRLDFNKHFKAHNFKARRMPISDLNAEKLGKLEMGQREKINEVLKKNLDILAYFEYELLSVK